MMRDVLGILNKHVAILMNHRGTEGTEKFVGPWLVGRWACKRLLLLRAAGEAAG